MKKTPAPKTLSSLERVSVGQKLAYGTGNLATMIGKQAPKTFSYQIYNIELGVISPIMIGNVIFLSRLIDAIANPIMGDISDKSTHRWGRRRPYLLLGSLLSALCFAALWMIPRGLSDTGYLLYFGALSILFYLALTVYTVPWYALGYELTTDYHERTRVMAYPSFVAPFAAILVGWMYNITYWDIFADRIEAIRWVGSLTAFAMLAAGLVSACFTDEPLHTAKAAAPPPNAKPVSAKKAQRSGLFTNIKQSLACKPFRMLSLTIACILLGSNMIRGLESYVTVYYLYGGEKEPASALLAWHSTVSTILTLAIIPVITQLATRYGKQRILAASLYLALAGTLAKLVLYTPAWPYLSLVVSIMVAPAMASVFMLVQAMVADVCDLDELQYHHRREGMFGAVYAFLFKTGISIAFLCSGYVIASTGFSQEIGGPQSESTLQGLRLLFAFIPALAFAVGIYFIHQYDLDEKQVRHIRDQLDARKLAL
ncbi:MFS transporter [Pelagicoccus sp. SDUM812005]|uniref:MFS transporter n=1 Tax=Pelagicoccus sp. SDUM812005 TaxID=3041257 RepID=UPI00280E93B3|nr:MFS transporter [Pelagicoccus sp. SDUM812005]MDQ8183514.1 MFS transporter [Pelagicoccus sp. SDUM812005]